MLALTQKNLLALENSSIKNETQALKIIEFYFLYIFLHLFESHLIFCSRFSHSSQCQILLQWQTSKSKF